MIILRPAWRAELKWRGVEFFEPTGRDPESGNEWAHFQRLPHRRTTPLRGRTFRVNRLAAHGSCACRCLTALSEHRLPRTGPNARALREGEDVVVPTRSHTACIMLRIVPINRVMRLLALLLIVLGVTGCMGGDTDRGSEAELVDRAAVTQAFQAGGEPLRLQVDFADALPESPIDANYAGDGRFEVLLFEDEDSAANQVESVLPLAGSKNGNFERHKNVVLFLSPKMKPARRMQLVAILESL